jgi:hypothetical protein
MSLTPLVLLSVAWADIAEVLKTFNATPAYVPVGVPDNKALGEKILVLNQALKEMGFGPNLLVWADPKVDTKSTNGYDLSSNKTAANNRATFLAGLDPAKYGGVIFNPTAASTPATTWPLLP